MKAADPAPYSFVNIQVREGTKLWIYDQAAMFRIRWFFAVPKCDKLGNLFIG